MPAYAMPAAASAPMAAAYAPVPNPKFGFARLDVLAAAVFFAVGWLFWEWQVWGWQIWCTKSKITFIPA